jgi:aminoglycoside phosphotransferase (APT) family kinase protein
VDQIVRVYREPAAVAAIERLSAFLASIDGKAAIPTPRILSIDPAGRFTIERRLPGISFLRRLPNLRGEPRRTAISRFVSGAGALAKITYDSQPYGHVLARDPVRAETWIGFLVASLDRMIARHGTTIAAEVGDPAALRAAAMALSAGIDERPPKTLVHGDYFAGNVLIDDALAVSGLVDFSSYTLVGDPAYDLLTAPIFLEMINETTPADFALAQHIARTRTGKDPRPAAFYRAYAAFAMADPLFALPPYPRLYPWAIANLKRLAKGELT